MTSESNTANIQTAAEECVISVQKTHYMFTHYTPSHTQLLALYSPRLPSGTYR